ncbi:MAG TPA: hypothetical protein PK977_15460 [Chitinophagaceae bacterium]|nr:hypothetical protein [Chitinophagaceae bacterium]HRF19572.1 hypothetical protein [Chitinophagaceae bacterium]
MKIKNAENLSAEQLQEEVNRGGRFVHYQYAVSFIVAAIKPDTGVYLIRKGESAVKESLFFTILSLLFGWWGIPFGPKHTIAAIRTNLRGGKDVTDEVVATIAGHILFREAEKRKAKARVLEPIS